MKLSDKKFAGKVFKAFHDRRLSSDDKNALRASLNAVAAFNVNTRKTEKEANGNQPEGTADNPIDGQRDSLSSTEIEGTGKIRLKMSQLAPPVPPASPGDDQGSGQPDQVADDGDSQPMDQPPNAGSKPLNELVKSLADTAAEVSERVQGGEAIIDGVGVEPAQPSDAGPIPSSPPKVAAIVELPKTSKDVVQRTLVDDNWIVETRLVPTESLKTYPAAPKSGNQYETNIYRAVDGNPEGVSISRVISNSPEEAGSAHADFIGQYTGKAPPAKRDVYRPLHEKRLEEENKLQEQKEEMARHKTLHQETPGGPLVPMSREQFEKFRNDLETRDIEREQARGQWEAEHPGVPYKEPKPSVMSAEEAIEELSEYGGSLDRYIQTVDDAFARASKDIDNNYAPPLSDLDKEMKRIEQYRLSKAKSKSDEHIRDMREALGVPNVSREDVPERGDFGKYSPTKEEEQQEPLNLRPWSPAIIDPRNTYTKEWLAKERQNEAVQSLYKAPGYIKEMLKLPFAEQLKRVNMYPALLDYNPDLAKAVGYEPDRKISNPLLGKQLAERAYNKAASNPQWGIYREDLENIISAIDGSVEDQAGITKDLDYFIQQIRKNDDGFYQYVGGHQFLTALQQALYPPKHMNRLTEEFLKEKSKAVPHAENIQRIKEREDKLNQKRLDEELYNKFLKNKQFGGPARPREAPEYERGYYTERSQKNDKSTDIPYEVTKTWPRAVEVEKPVRPSGPVVPTGVTPSNLNRLRKELSQEGDPTSKPEEFSRGISRPGDVEQLAKAKKSLPQHERDRLDTIIDAKDKFLEEVNKPVNMVVPWHMLEVPQPKPDEDGDIDPLDVEVYNNLEKVIQQSAMATGGAPKSKHDKITKLELLPAAIKYKIMNKGMQELTPEEKDKIPPDIIKKISLPRGEQLLTHDDLKKIPAELKNKFLDRGWRGLDFNDILMANKTFDLFDKAKSRAIALIMSSQRQKSEYGVGKDVKAPHGKSGPVKKLGPGVSVKPVKKESVDQDAKNYYHDLFGGYGVEMTKDKMAKIADTIDTIAELRGDNVDSATFESILAFLSVDADDNAVSDMYARIAVAGTDDVAASVIDKTVIDFILNNIKNGGQLTLDAANKPGIYVMAINRSAKIANFINRVADGKMKTPKPKGQLDDAVDVDKMDDMADGDHELARPAHLHMEVAESAVEGAYTKLMIQWDPDDPAAEMSSTGLKNALISFVKGLESKKEYKDFGFLGTIDIEEIDPDAGVAVVFFRTMKPSDAMPVQKVVEL